MTDIAAADALVALLSSASDESLAPLAERLRSLSPERDGPSTASIEADAWMNLNRAAEYAGISAAAMHKHTARRTVPFEQDGPGCMCWFKRSKLDAWRRGEWRPGDATS